MNLIDDLIAHLPDDMAVKSVWVGVHWTAVISRHCGLASTLVGSQPHGHAKVRDVGRLHSKSTHELIKYARSDNLLEASIGVAAINSLIDVAESQIVDANAGEVLMQEGHAKHVALVGHFPFIPQLRASAGELWVIEQQPTAAEYPHEAAADLSPLRRTGRRRNRSPAHALPGRDLSADGRCAAGDPGARQERLIMKGVRGGKPREVIRPKKETPIVLVLGVASEFLACLASSSAV